MTNPFDTDVEETDAATEVEDLDVEELEELEDTVEESEDKPTKEKAPKEPKEKKPARPPVAEGYVTPVAFARILTEHMHARGHSNRNGRIGGDGEVCDHKVNPVPPQMVYSYIKNNGPTSRNPLPIYTDPEVTGGREYVLKAEEALEWWDAMITRIAESKAARAEKEAAKAEKAKNKESATDDVVTEEEASEVEEAE